MAGTVSFVAHVQYSLLMVLLLSFTILFLPRTTPASFFQLPMSSLDKPQYDWMVPITGDPRLTLLWWCAGSILIVRWRAGWIRSVWVNGQTAEGRLERVKSKDKELLAATVITIIAGLLYSSILVLFGAPLASHHIQTCLMGFLLAILTVFTPAFCIGPSFIMPFLPSVNSSGDKLNDPSLRRVTLIRLFAELAPHTIIEEILVYPSTCAILGAWTCAIPIALDWDRPWQAWPLTCAVGAIAGYTLGTLGACASHLWKLLVAAEVSATESKTSDPTIVEKKMKKKAKNRVKS